MPLAGTLRSALVNLKATQKLIVFILDGGISQRNKRRIIRSLNPEQVEIIINGIYQWLLA